MMKKGMFGLSKIVKYLIYSDLVFYTGWGLISPIFAIFILDSIIGGNAFVVGMAAGINLIVRSILRVPFGMYADKSQKTSYNFMFWGLLASSLIPIGFIFSKTAMHVYFFQGLLGATLGLSTAGWAGIFARHMDKGKESTEWGIDAVAVGLGPGIAAAIGGIIVTFLSFNFVFILVTIMGLVGTFLLIFIKPDILNKEYKNQKKACTPLEIRRLKKLRIP
jgi:sugar phosphate permease